VLDHLPLAQDELQQLGRIGADLVRTLPHQGLGFGKE
jgi:hypothetical protein